MTGRGAGGGSGGGMLCDLECDHRSGLTSEMLIRAADNVSRRLFIRV